MDQNERDAFCIRYLEDFGMPLNAEEQRIMLNTMRASIGKMCGAPVIRRIETL